jgi:hypothetical protein
VSPSNLNSRGSLTAWLRPFRNNFAVDAIDRFLVYTISIDPLGEQVTAWVGMLRSTWIINRALLRVMLEQDAAP